MGAEQRWPRIQPFLPDLVAAVRAGSRREVMEHFMKKLYSCDSVVNAVVESCVPLETTIMGTASLKPLPLEGLPFLVKDNMDVKGFNTVCGSSLYLNNSPATHDCNIVTTLRELGAVPVGKTNVPNLSLDVQTFNDVYGTTCNPYNAELTAGGSSGGSAAAVALGFAAFSGKKQTRIQSTTNSIAGNLRKCYDVVLFVAVGNDWNGSLRIPAAFCGVCSLRASRGRMSLDGRDHILPPIVEDPEALAHMLVAGLFTKTVADLETCMRPLLEMSPRRGSLYSSKKGFHVEETVNFQSSQSQGNVTRIDQRSILFGVVTSFGRLPLDSQIESAMRKIPMWLESSPELGVTKLEAVMAEDFSLDVKKIHGAMKGASEVFVSAVGLKSKDQLEKLEWVRAVQASSSKAVDAFMESGGFSALILPVCAVLPPEHNHTHAPVPVNGEKVPYWIAMCSYVEPFSVSGNPVVTIPLCWIKGKPCGIQVIGKLGEDEELLRMCVELEQCLHVAETGGVK